MLRFLLMLLAGLCGGACGPQTTHDTPQSAGLSPLVLDTEADIQILALQSANRDNAEAIVLFLHGTPGDAQAWMDTLAQTPDNIWAFAVDRPGYGATVPNTAVVSLEGQANAVVLSAQAALDSIEGQRPIILVGHSYGGPVAVKAALLRPDLFSAVILAAAALDPALEKVHWAQRLATYQPVKAMIGHTMRTANAELLALKEELQVLEHDLTGLEVPTFILHGTADTLVPIENVAFMEDRFPKAYYCKARLLEGQNHFLPWETIAEIWSVIEYARTHPC